jgi:uncharacterized protein YcaQ
MKPLRIENKIARQLWLESQGLSVSPKGTLDLLGMIKKLGFVQLDSIQVVSRAHHHLYSRINFKLNRAAALAEWRQLLSA